MGFAEDRNSLLGPGSDDTDRVLSWSVDNSDGGRESCNVEDPDDDGNDDEEEEESESLSLPSLLAGGPGGSWDIWVMGTECDCDSAEAEDVDVGAGLALVIWKGKI